MGEDLKRYFIVFYYCIIKRGKYSGHTDVLREDGGYVNRRQFIEDTIRDSVHDVSSVVITNIIELNESDYLDWYR